MGRRGYICKITRSGHGTLAYDVERFEKRLEICLAKSSRTEGTNYGMVYGQVIEYEGGYWMCMQSDENAQSFWEGCGSDFIYKHLDNLPTVECGDCGCIRIVGAKYLTNEEVDNLR